VDVYSLGVTFLESFLRESMKGNVLFDVLETKQYGIFKRPKLPSNISPDALVQLIDRSMDVDPEKRPMAKEIAKSIGKILQKVSKEETLPPIPK
jgi:serine/threonine protein kinase